MKMLYYESVAITWPIFAPNNCEQWDISMKLAINLDHLCGIVAGEGEDRK